MYELKFTNSFKKDVKRCFKRSYDMALLQQMFEYLESTGTVPENYKPHPLKGNYIDTIECHIKPDWLLFWRIDESTK